MGQLYVYGIVRASGGALELPAGVAGARVLAQRDAEADLAALVSPLDDDRLRASRRDLRAHEEVLRAALASRDPVLPLRFGTVHRSAADVSEHLLGPRGPELERLLVELEGLVQLELRAFYADEAALLQSLLQAEPELVELRARTRRGGYGAKLALGEAVLAAYDRRRRNDEARLLDRLAPLAREWRAEEELPERVAAQLSFLVERRAVAGFEAAAGALAREELRLRLVGPLPPYSFVALELQAAGAPAWGS